jgi:hypothetical protein
MLEIAGEKGAIFAIFDFELQFPNSQLKVFQFASMIEVEESAIYPMDEKKRKKEKKCISNYDVLQLQSSIFDHMVGFYAVLRITPLVVDKVHLFIGCRFLIRLTWNFSKFKYYERATIIF